MNCLSSLRFGFITVSALTLGHVAIAQENPGAMPEAVPVGKGSYASFPPTQNLKKSKDVTAFLARELFIDESRKNAPVPTNDWWTDLIYSRYAGNMWAYPFTVSANDGGLKIFLPNSWNDKGGGMELESPLEIAGKVTPPANGPEWILISDFEDKKFANGWRTEGGAFGDGPTQGPVPGQTPVSGFVGTGLANSHHGGDGSTGVLISPNFTIERKYLHFMVGGGKNEKDLSVQLMIDGKAVQTTTGENSETLKWRSWDLSQWKGQSAQLIATDHATGGWGHILLDQVILSDQPTPPRAAGADVFQPDSAKALRWSDWLLTFRMEQSPTQLIDVTMGRGLPYVWLECKGVDPVLRLTEATVLFDAQGNPVNDPSTVKRLGVDISGHFFALVSPAGATWKKEGALLTLQLNGKPGWLAVAALPQKTDLTRLADHATAIPRNTRIDWTYRPEKAEVETRWTIETQMLEGPAVEPLQGWLPHHYRGTQNDLKMEDGLVYQTPRGKLCLAQGHSFQITYPFKGIVPTLPAPKEEPDIAHGFKMSRMKDYLQGYVAKMSEKKDADKKFGADTYWGGKDLLLGAHYMVEAKLLGDDSYAVLHDAVEKTLKNWLTYTPGEESYYFTRYPKYGAMVGFDSSYGSYSFTDNHFHYGYFTYASALLGMMDEDFLKDYGGMAKLVAKQYANWDRQDTSFPFMRTFDVWGGHSYAGGSSSGGGNNQESSSEAMQSWAGLFFLGESLQDKDMSAAAVMGYAMEGAATMEYWNDYHGWKEGPEAANFPPAYKHSIVGILGDSGGAFGTFFQGQPMYIYGIQWLPLSPALDYLGRDPEFAKFQLESMLTSQAEAVPGSDFSKLGHDWGHVTLGYIMQYDAEDAAKRLQEFWDKKDPIATEAGSSGNSYYLINAMRQLGKVQWQDHTDAPCSTVYGQTGSDKISSVIYNPSTVPLTVMVYRGSSAAGTVTVPPRTLLRADELQPVK